MKKVIGLTLANFVVIFVILATISLTTELYMSNALVRTLLVLGAGALSSYLCYLPIRKTTLYKYSAMTSLVAYNIAILIIDMMENTFEVYTLLNTMLIALAIYLINEVN